MLLVRFAHAYLNHGGVDSIICFLRKEYEIFGLRLMAKAVKKGCVHCQVVDAKACNETVAPLPRLRVSRAPVFSVTGIDFAGPVYCADFPKVKFYICLFVCGVVRAIHLELVGSLTSEDFTLAFRKFCALKRVPSVVYSDNGTNFVGGQKVLDTYLGPAAPQWRFICPRSPWWGGWWERLVRSVKNAIRKTLSRRWLYKAEFEVCLSEVAASINSRPLTFVGTGETKVPLTPNHFLCGQGCQGLEGEVVEDSGQVDASVLSLRHQELVERQEEFWKVWSDEYLRSLPAAYQKFKKSGNLSVGSVVLIKEDNMARMKWLMAVVLSLESGVDGVPRMATLRTSKGKVCSRAIQRLYDLEVSEVEVLDPVSSHFESGDSSVQSVDSPVHLGDSEVSPGCQEVSDPTVSRPACEQREVVGERGEVEKRKDEEVGGFNVTNDNFHSRSRFGRVLRAPTRYGGKVTL